MQHGEPAEVAPLDAPDLATLRGACLVKASGDGPLLLDLKQAQAAAERSQAGAPWALAGHAWLALADAGTHPQAVFNAEGCLEIGHAAAPADLDVMELEATLLQREHRFAAAHEKAQDVLGRDRERTLALGIAIDALIELGRYDEAAALADRLGNLRPGPAVHARAAFFAFLSGERERAKIEMRRALAIGRNPRQPQATAWAFAEAARLFHHEGDYSGAQAVFEEALKWSPGHAPAHLGIGRALIAQGRHADALPHLTKAEEAGLVEAAWLAGDAHLGLGDMAKAEETYRRFETLAAHERLLLAQFLAITGRDPARALAAAEAEAKVRGGVWVDDTLAWALYRAGRLDDALIAAKRAIARGTKDARILYHAGAIMLAAKDPNGEALVAEALALSPRFDPREADDAKKLLAR